MSILPIIANTAQKMKFSIKDFFSKCDQICNFLRIWSHLLMKILNGKLHIFVQCNIVEGLPKKLFVRVILRDTARQQFEKLENRQVTPVEHLDTMPHMLLITKSNVYGFRLNALRLMNNS